MTLTDEQLKSNGAAPASGAEEAVTPDAIPGAPDPGARYDKWNMSEAEVVEFATDREDLIAKTIQGSTYLQAEVLAWRFRKLTIERDAEIEELRLKIVEMANPKGA